MTEHSGNFEDVSAEPIPSDESILADGILAQQETGGIEETTNPENQYYKRLRVMVIEDDEENMELFIGYLKEIGVRRITAINNADTAFFQITEDIELLPHVIVLEIALAGTNGIQFLAKIRAHENEKVSAIPAVVVTALEGSRAFKRATQKGISAFIRKPFSSGSLRNALDDASKGKLIPTPEEIMWSWLDEADERDRRAREQAARQHASQQPWFVRAWKALWGL